jgi:hypothetical protein
MTRAFSTLIGAALAGGLVWVAAQMDRDTTGGYWATAGLLAAGGLALALARLPDVGMRTLVPSPTTFGLAFIPALIAAAWVIVAAEPSSNWASRHVLNWSGDVGLTRVVNDLKPFALVLAFGLGVTLGLVFERRRVREVVEEPVAAPSHTRELRPEPGPREQAPERRRDRELVGSGLR